MTDSTPKPVWYRQIRWRLTLSYSLVLYLAVIAVEALVIAVPLAYFYYHSPDLFSGQTFWAALRPVLRDDGFIVPVVVFIGHMISRQFSVRIERLVEAADAWAKGRFTYRLHDDSDDELGILARRLQSMSEQLQKTVETEHELAAARERNRIARDLHDTVKQQAFAIQMELSAVRNLLNTDPGAAAGMLDDALDHMRQARADLNTLIQQVPPEGLAHKTLGVALREYLDRINMMGVDVSLLVAGDREMPVEMESALFRATQGALSNVAKHSQAKTAVVDYRYGDDGILLRVTDDGIGFDPDSPHLRTYGLGTMRARVKEFDGTLTIESSPGSGTSVTANVPLPSDEGSTEARKVAAT